MPNIKAAEKWTLQSEKRAARNRSIKSRLKTLFKEAAASGDSATARRVEGAFDKAAAKGVVHRNKAARKKGRLAKAVHRSGAAAPKAAKGKSSRKK